MARKSRKNIEIEENVFENKLLRTAIYLRLSVEDKRKKVDNSIDSQRSIVESFIELNPEFEIVAEFIDNGTTGTNFEREGFKSMINEVEKGNLDCIIVKDLSRFGRNVIDTGYYIEKFLPTHNVRFVAVNDNFDSNDNSQGNIILPIKNMINEAYARDLSRKIKAQKRTRMKNGEWTSGMPPYGYLNDPNRKYKLIVNEEIADTIRQIFKFVEHGMLIAEIVRKFNTEGVPCPLATNEKVRKHKSEHRLEWQHSRIKKILRNENYIGNMVQGTNVSKNPDDWVRVENTHEAIIDKETFFRVQNILDERRNKHNDKVRTPYEENIFKGKLYCMCCGRIMDYKRKGQGEYNYACSTNNKLGKGSCVGVAINKNILINIVNETLGKQYEVLVDNQDKFNNSNDNISILNEINSLQNGIRKNKKFLRTLYENLVSEVITLEDYTNFKTIYEERISNSENVIKSLEGKEKHIKKSNLELDSIKNNILDLINGNELKAEVVDALIEKILINKGRKVEIYFKYSFSELFDIGLNNCNSANFEKVGEQ